MIVNVHVYTDTHSHVHVVTCVYIKQVKYDHNSVWKNSYLEGKFSPLYETPFLLYIIMHICDIIILPQEAKEIWYAERQVNVPPNY